MSNEQLAEFLDHATRVTKKHVVPIYLIDHRDVPWHVGTGFLVEFNEEEYLVTAAHTLVPVKGSEDEGAVPMVYVARNTQALIKDFAYCLKSPDGSKDYDVAVAHMPKDEATGLSVFHELGKSAVKLRQFKPHLLPRQRRLYLFVGYPSSKNKVAFQRGQIKSQPVGIGGSSPENDAYEKMKILPKDYVLMDFTGKVDSYGNQPPAPAGFSGSPVFWVYWRTNKIEDLEYQLVGVVTDFLKKDSYIRSTDVEIVLHTLVNYKTADWKVPRKI